MTIAVIGASGTAGARVVARLKGRGVAVVGIARAFGVDLVSGHGLTEALEGVDVVIDVSNPMPADGDSDIVDTVTTATRNLVGACAAQGVQRVVALTIACIEDPAFDEFPYYVAKRAAKEITLSSPVPATMVSSTQWFEFATNPAAVTFNERDVLVEDWMIQPIAADTVADVLVETALGQTHPPITVTGPREVRLPQLTSKLLSHYGDDRRVRAVEPALPALGAGALRAPGHAIVLGPDLDGWLGTVPPDGEGNRTGSERVTTENR
ncbi:NmrA family protein [Mycobacterium sp. 852002-51163_SCH5372311]|uniref:SDR family oxidoreductase n=1 Tax=Mycobacterium sp. 852002-51163_SCH5372311 TaxID=1834097 RepID=UPI0007FE454A|nr:NAD(P)H-binding protein [Mycobacterium sp. 852002-51163_SCH5372311]OBF81357.1 NmrA family protein [Mycobacterium sp. 852002-51163_SCH5372311]